MLWAGSKDGLGSFGSNGPSLQLGADTVTESEHVRLLGVTISSDHSVDKRVATVCSQCFYWLRQLKRVRRLLDDESTKTLVHAFVTSRVDYCNTVLGAPKSVSDKLQRVQNAAARIVTDTRKFDRSTILHAMTCTGWTSRSGFCISSL